MKRRSESPTTTIRGGGNPIRHNCRPDEQGRMNIGNLWRCPECDCLWKCVTDNVAWVGWVHARWLGKIRALIGGV